MWKSKSLIFLIIGIIIIRHVSSKDIDLTFPNDFLIGVASSAFQTEGGWNVGGKAESVWDYFIHNNPSEFINNSTADIACDSYKNYKEDIRLLNEIGVNHYRFSISWSRILPTGRVNNINKEAIQHYHNILDELEKYNIIPFVTIYHWDHPQILEKIGGWLNEEMAQAYSEYARVIFQEFGHRIKHFLTLNEPGIFCTLGYTGTPFPPGSDVGSSGQYLCVQNMLKGHALAYRLYNKEFRKKQHGKVGITLHCSVFYNKEEDDHLTNEIAFELECGWQANPIFSKHGDYPKIMKEKIAERSKLQGYYSSKLPTLSKAWIKLIRGSADFFGVNHYVVAVVSPLKNVSISSSPNDLYFDYSYDPDWGVTDSTWYKVFPNSIGDLLRTIKKKYNNPPVYIMENGVAYDVGLNDISRINYLYLYMKEVLLAIKRDKCNVKAYTIWSFLDSFEFANGYTYKFGLVQVDFNDKNRKRNLKKSAYWLNSVLKSRKLHLSTNFAD